MMKCKLCGGEKELVQGHIIPKFVFDWLKETSAAGRLRFAKEPNLRKQDGPKERKYSYENEKPRSQRLLERVT